MTEKQADELDHAMSEIGMRVANEVLGKSLEDDDVDDILVERLPNASKDQLFEVADIMIDILALSQIVKAALSDDQSLDEEEIEELMGFIHELESDSKETIKAIVNGS